MDTDDNIKNALDTVLSELPGPVQEFVLGPDRPRIAIELAKKYNLHVDQAGALEQAFMFMLLGISSPEEFVDALTKSGIPSESIGGLVKDVNEQVFLPLRKAEQRETVVTRGVPTPTEVTPPAKPLLPGSAEPVPTTEPRIVPPQPFQTPAPLMPQYQMPPQPVYGYIPQQVQPQMVYAPPYGMPAIGYGAPVYMWPQPQMQQVPPWQMPVQQVAPQPAHTTAPEIVPVTVPPVQHPPKATSTPPAAYTPVKPRATLNPGSSLGHEYVADPYRESFTQ